jgi:hypothetical protein
MLFASAIHSTRLTIQVAITYIDLWVLQIWELVGLTFEAILQRVQH